VWEQTVQESWQVCCQVDKRDIRHIQVQLRQTVYRRQLPTRYDSGNLLGYTRYLVVAVLRDSLGISLLSCVTARCDWVCCVWFAFVRPKYRNYFYFTVHIPQFEHARRLNGIHYRICTYSLKNKIHAWYVIYAYCIFDDLYSTLCLKKFTIFVFVIARSNVDRF